MNDFFHRVFLQAPGSGSTDFTSDFLLGVLFITLTSCVLVYLVTLALLASAYRSEAAARLIDAETRIKLCWSWAALAVFLLLGAAIFWIRWEDLIPHNAGLIAELSAFSCYLTAAVLIAVLWVIVYFSLHADVKRANKAVS